MSSDVRNVLITGGAKEVYGKRKTSKKQKQKGGYDSPPGPQVTTANNVRNAKGMMGSVNIMRGGSAPGGPLSYGPVNPGPSTVPTTVPIATPPNISQSVGHTAPTPGAIQTPALAAQAQAQAPPPEKPQSGGKLVLAPKKKKGLILAPPGGKKKTRKIRVQLSGMKKRITRANSIHKESHEKPIAEIKSILESAKLLKAKPGKEVPDTLVRSIYKDYQLLRNRAL